MKYIVVTISLLVFSSVSPLLVAGQITSECQSQAKEYGVEPELVSQYVNDCVASMGGEVQPTVQAVGGADAGVSSDAEGVAEGVADDLDSAQQSGAMAIQ